MYYLHGRIDKFIRVILVTRGGDNTEISKDRNLKMAKDYFVANIITNRQS